jgi:predicted deacylase
LSRHPVGGDENLTIDWMTADALQDKTRLLIFTTGEHGIEGYVGSTILQLFLREYLARLDPRSVGLLLVHAINPWGMEHRRRTNAANVDLNRNFQAFDPSFNPEYARLAPLLMPQGPIRNLFLSDLVFALRLSVSLIAFGPQTLRKAALLGQYRFPCGIYYGGEAPQEETRTMIELYRTRMREYEHIVHLDMHTGYGPRYQMSLVNSCLEPTDSREFVERFGYPRVVKSDPAEFYSIQGDMVDWVYTLVGNEFPGKRLYSTSFEFGTYGDSMLTALRSLRAMILENQLHWFAASAGVQARIQHDFQELFFPEQDRWREAALTNARRALEGIFRAQDFLAR